MIGLRPTPRSNPPSGEVRVAGRARCSGDSPTNRPRTRDSRTVRPAARQVPARPAQATQRDGVPYRGRLSLSQPGIEGGVIYTPQPVGDYRGAVARACATGYLFATKSPP